MSSISGVLVTGGAGYVGAVLVPKLLQYGYAVTVLDTYWYGEDALTSVRKHPALTEIKGDIRHPHDVERAVAGNQAVIHLACVSNDPSFELDPALGKAINFDATRALISMAKSSGINRFVYASSSSVYGVKQETEVTEDLSLEPLTDYSKYKALIEAYLLQQQTPDFNVLILRPATVCGYSPRLRLDLTVNILTAHALTKGEITVFGGDQIRPNIHIEDITDAYVLSLQCPTDQIAGKIYNVGYENYSVSTIASTVKHVLGNQSIKIHKQPSIDIRSYRVSSRKIKQDLGFTATHTVEEAIQDIQQAYTAGLVTDALTNPYYYNIKTMQLLAAVTSPDKGRQKGLRVKV